MFYSCFCFFSVFFPSVTKIPDNRSRERLNGFSWNFTKRLRGKCSFQRRTEMGARPPNNSLGAKNYTLRTWWWRLASYWELACWLWHCAATAVALKRHERANAFNLVYVFLPKVFSSVYYNHTYIYTDNALAWSLALICHVADGVSGQRSGHLGSRTKGQVVTFTNYPSHIIGS